MRAVVHDKYGPPDVLRVAQVEGPMPRQGEILVKIHASTVNRTDCHRRAASPFLWRLFAGLRRPRQRILGSELAGEVEAVGLEVTEFTAGDQVFGLNLALGAHAEYLCLPQEGLIANLGLARSLGAGHVIDYTAEDFTSNGQTYEVIYAAVGKHSFRYCKGSLRRGGIYLSADGWLNLVPALAPARAESKKVMLAIPPRYARPGLLFLRHLIEAGKYRAVIDRRYPLEAAEDQTLAAASCLLEASRRHHHRKQAGAPIRRGYRGIRPASWARTDHAFARH